MNLNDLKNIEILREPNEIINLNFNVGAPVHGLDRNLIDKLGIKYVCGIPQPMLDSVWLLGCSNLPEKLPSVFSKIDSGYNSYMRYINHQHDLFIERMKNSSMGAI